MVKMKGSSIAQFGSKQGKYCDIYLFMLVLTFDRSPCSHWLGSTTGPPWKHTKVVLNPIFEIWQEYALFRIHSGPSDALLSAQSDSSNKFQLHSINKYIEKANIFFEVVCWWEKPLRFGDTHL
ncbi:unnamed protein product [Meganyctiphanes norvegica]|uniref:Uncharacterized protein n=1 Tax=Meganyctiphanes norvegica TaxID=48144 RepID=A0AAV2R318_MEGNR